MRKKQTTSLSRAQERPSLRLAVSFYLGRLINVSKWPVAIVSLITLPASVSVAQHKLGALSWSSPSVARFWVGLSLALIASRSLLKWTGLGAFFMTVVHELTHALAAWLTLNRVTGVRLTWRSGGAVKVEGHPHWLITIAPYISPTLSALLWLVVWGSELITGRPLLSALWLDLFMGASLGLFWGSLWSDLSPRQSDIKKAGYLFSLLVIPHAALLSSLFVIIGGCGAQRLGAAWSELWLVWWRALIGVWYALV